jgi:hypothetical protein
VSARVAAGTPQATATFANVLNKASNSAQLRTASALPQRSARLTRTTLQAPSVNPTSPTGPTPLSRTTMLERAKSLMGIPYVWGGNSSTGLDCSAFVSKVWGLSRQTTDTLDKFARPIPKDELRAGDALNLTTADDPDRGGHVRLFDKWANPEKTKMWVYEETPPRSVHHIINWDPSYTPLRRVNTTEGLLAA